MVHHGGLAAQGSVAARGWLLALETSGARPSAALLRDGRLHAEEWGGAGRVGAESVLPCIDALLARSGVALSAVEAFALAIGPGSFTGLRVGLATVKGLAFGGDRPVAPVSTLAALARGAGADLPVVALLDARRGELYAAGFVRAGEELAPWGPAEGVYAPEELARALPGPCRLRGEGVPLCGERVRACAEVAVTLGEAAVPCAADVGALGHALLARAGGIAAEALVPRYVRRAQAEAQRTGRPVEAPEPVGGPGPGLPKRG